MEPFIVQGTTNTPTIRLNHRSNRFIFEGVSLPENIVEFYQPVFDWIEEYFENPNPDSVFEFKFHYLNTASSKMVSNIFRILDDHYKKGINISVAWYYDMEDTEIKEFGDDLEEIFDIPMEFLIKE